jgi:hypothetical protein
MTLAYDARRSTRDIDAIRQPHGAVLEDAWAVADDITYLVKHLELTCTADVLAVCTTVFPDEPAPDRSRLILDDLFDER